jgi:hypothetical protein
VKGLTFAGRDVAVEVITCGLPGDPVRVLVGFCYPSDFDPATMFTVEGDWEIPLQGVNVLCVQRTP